MINRPLACPRCDAPLPGPPEEADRVERCLQCRGRLEAEIFTALFRPIQAGATATMTVTEEDAGCFYHPQKKAILPCDVCGRFLCALCDVEWNDQHLCPGCLDAQKKKGRLPSLDNRRTLYDSLALGLAVLPVLIWPLTVITAPAAIFVSIRYWKSPGSLIRRSKFRFVLAMLVSLLQLTGWGSLAWALFKS